MHKAILGAASILTLASPAVAADLPVTPIAKFQATSTEQRRLSLSRSRLRSWFADLLL